MSTGRKHQAGPERRIVTGFGSAPLSLYLVHFLRARGDMPAVVLTPFAARARDLTRRLETEGIGNARVLSFADYAASLAPAPGTIAFTCARRWLLFHRAFMETSVLAQWRAFASGGDRLEALFRLFDSLRAGGFRSSDLGPLEAGHSMVGPLASLMRAYESHLMAKGIADLADLLRVAAGTISNGGVKPGEPFIFDLFHDARPDEFELALAIAQQGAPCLFLCDPSAPAPADRAVVPKVESELRRRLGDLPVEAAPAPPNEELGRKIAFGTLDALGPGVELMAFNDLAGQCRGLAHSARSLKEEGIPPEEMAFFLAGSPDAGSEALLLYQLEQAGLLASGALEQPGIGAPLAPEVNVLFGLLRDPGRNDLAAKAISMKMAKDEDELQRKLSQLAAEAQSVSLETLIERAFASLLPGLNELERQALQIYRTAALDFNELSGTGVAAADLSGFLLTLGPYLAKSAREDREQPPIFLTPERGATHTYAAVFLPSLTSEMRRMEPGLAQMDEFAHALEAVLGSPVHLPDPRDAFVRARWECAAAVAGGASVYLSFYRRRGARPVEPAAWLRGVLPEAKAQQHFLAALPAARNKIQAPPHARPPAQPASITVVPELSVSAMKDYIACPHLFYLRHVLGLKTPPTERMSLGSLVHEVLAKFHKPGQTEFSEGKILSFLDEAAAEREMAREILSQAGALLSAYAAQMKPDATLSVERKFRLPLGGAIIRGRIDRIAAAPGGVKVIDYKLSGSGKERKHRNAAARRLDDVQLPIYMLAARAMGQEVGAFSYVYLDYENTGRPHEILLRFSEDAGPDAISGADMAGSRGRIEELIKDILAGCPEFGIGENAPCKHSPAWCAFSTMCTALGE